MNIETKANESFAPLEYTSSREFITDLQPWLEAETGTIFKSRYIAEFGQDKWDKDFGAKTPTPNEPEDLYTLSQNKPQIYFEVLKKSAEFWEKNFEQSIHIAFELGENDSHESMRIYYSALAKILAQNFQKTSKLSEEKLAERIEKELIRRAPYYQAAMNMLMRAKSGIRINSLKQTIRKAVEHIVWPDNTRGGKITVDFKTGKKISSVAGKDPIVVEKEEENPEFEQKYNQMLELIRDKVDARRYVDILVGPVNSHSTIRERTLIQIRRNPGFVSLTEIFKQLVGDYEQDPQRVLSLGYVDFLRFLGNLTAIADTASILDSYEKKLQQYSLVILCEKLLVELTEVYFLKHSGQEVSAEDIQSRLGMIIDASTTVDILSGKVEGKSMVDAIMGREGEFEIFNNPEVMEKMPWIRPSEPTIADLLSVQMGAIYNFDIQKGVEDETLVSMVTELFTLRKKEPNAIFIIAFSKELQPEKKELFIKLLKERNEAESITEENKGEDTP